MIRAALCDDEAPARARLRRLLLAQDVSLVGEATNGVEALELAARERPDVLFLDIDMPELDGLATAAALGPQGPRVVFVTAHDEHALKAFELSAVDYLVKPVSGERLAATLTRLSNPQPSRDLSAALGRLGSRRLAVRSGSKFVVVDAARVSAIIARDHYAAILVDGRELLADDPLDEVARRLDPERFFRIHRSGVVNLDFIRQLDRLGDRKYEAVLSDPASTRLAVSRDRLDELRTRLGISRE